MLKRNVVITKGSEPIKVLPTHSSLGDALNWYNYHFDRSVGRKWIADLLKSFGMADDVPAFMAAPDIKVTSTMCAIAKIALNGNTFPDGVFERFLTSLEEVIDIGNEIITARKRRATLRFRDNDKKIADKYIADIEDMLDLFYNNNYKSYNLDMNTWLSITNPTTTQTTHIINFYIPLLNELTEHKEDYVHLTKTQYKSYIEFVSFIIKSLVSHLKGSKQEEVTKAEPVVRKPRKAKVIPVTKIVKNVDYKKENAELKISSIEPKAIVGARALVLYNDKYKVMTFLNAKTNDGLSVKGKTVININHETSFAKVVNNAKTIQTMTSGGIRFFKQTFDGIANKSKAASGRMNKDTLIIKAYK